EAHGNAAQPSGVYRILEDGTAGLFGVRCF
ncbi:MAG: hypothetical protein K0Q71_2036, partial [Thermomicrobiales bacterium]|nr:hypothetical protein [Thermomicrobiales bacterium]